ncbi:hypothetical protein OHB12_35265 [Nocardia sp. NBC_01730]|uniref:hypothetical protein n=1 Tax=Nocardia sp. NBC_01730 TaxID=2975998 RepID=UPI002E0F5F9B|nr:hypothetical protein OHB12_35265 [Nocardia sp. NBC_01730]
MSRTTIAATLLLSAATCSAALTAAPVAAAAPPEEARLAGCEFGTAATTYDYARFGDHARRVRELSTGDFRAEFENFRPNIQSGAEAAHARAQADSADCRVVSGDDNRAEVAVDVVRTVTSDETDGMPQTGRVSMTVTVDNVDGRWLVSKVQSN